MMFRSSLTCFFAVIFFAAIAGPLFAGSTYTMKNGDTLWDLANKFYGDPTLYPLFLEVNQIDNVRTIPTGKVLIVPSMNEIKNISKEHDPEKRKEMINGLNGNSSSSSDSRLSQPLIVNGENQGATKSPGNNYTPGTLMKDALQPVVSGTIKASSVIRVEAPKK